MSWARIKPVCNQVELHPMLAQRKLVDGCRRLVGWWVGSWLQGRHMAGQAVCAPAPGRPDVQAAFQPGSASFAPLSLVVRPRHPPFLLQGVQPIAYGPLGHGKGGLLDHPVVVEVAEAAAKSPAQVGLLQRLLAPMRAACVLCASSVLQARDCHLHQPPLQV